MCARKKCTFQTFSSRQINCGQARYGHRSKGECGNASDGTVSVGSFEPNPWGLHDMHGNVAEWTASDYDKNTSNLKTVRGGSWRDRPKYATAATRDGYFPFQKVFNVGFRMVLNDE